MKSLKQVVTLVAIAAGLYLNTGLHAYDIYAAVWHKKGTNQTLKLMGEVHGLSLGEKGTNLDIESAQKTRRALSKTKINPCWIAEKVHGLGTLPKISLEKLEQRHLIAEFTIKNAQTKPFYKQKTFITKNKPNLFSSKDFMLPKENNDMQKFSPHISDLRGNNIEYPFLDMFENAANKVTLQYMDDLRTYPKGELEKIHKEIRSFNNQHVSTIESYNPFNKNSSTVNICKILKKEKFNFEAYKKQILQNLQQEPIHSYMFISLAKDVLSNVGNHMLACEEILKYTKDNDMLTVLKNLFTRLVKTLILNENSIIRKFFNEKDLSLFNQLELENELQSFEKAFTCDLTDFGFLAKAVQLMPFAKDVTIYAGNDHIIGIEKLLQQAGYECLWSKQSKDEYVSSLALEDLETFFSYKPALNTANLQSKL